MSLDPESPEQQAVYYVEDRVNQSIDRVRGALAPVWEVSERIAQTLIWLSAGALVLSVTLAQIFIGSNVTVKLGWLLPAAWTLFVLTVVLTLLRMSKFMGMRTAPLEFEKQKKELRNFVRQKYAEPNAGYEIDSKVEEMWKTAWEKPAQAIRWHDIFTYASGITFLMGLVALMVFTIVNLPLS